MSDNKLYIADQTNPLLKKLGLNPPDVRSLTITPTKVIAEVYKRNERGEKFIVEDLIQYDTIEYEVRT